MPELEYKCGYCGKLYPTIEQRTTCEMTCGAAKKKAEAEKAEANRKAEEAKAKEEYESKKKARYDDLMKDLETTAKKYSDFVKDYGELKFKIDQKTFPASRVFDIFDLIFGL